MLAQAAHPLGVTPLLLDPAPHPPAGELAEVIQAAYTDKQALANLAKRADVVTYEFENVPASALKALPKTTPVFPPPLALATAQDRLLEKTCFQQLGIATAAFHPVSGPKCLDAFFRGKPKKGVLKTRKMGYDGKGQAVVKTHQEAETFLEAHCWPPSLLERFVPFQCEVSQISVRSIHGEMKHYPLALNHHRGGILRLSQMPAPHLPESLTQEAKMCNELILETFNYVGVLCVEYFVTAKGLMANEMAPRVHNSGHQTDHGALCSQFENHVRAVMDLPLGPASLTGQTAMVNLIGVMPPAPSILNIPGARLHDYGKHPKAGRKLGHVTVLGKNQKELAGRLASVLKIVDPSLLNLV